MKKFLFLILSVTIGLYVTAQERAIVTKSLRDISVERIYQPPIKGNSAIDNSVTPGIKQNNIFTENIIGKTEYDLQTNKSVQNRIYYHNDGTIGAVWTMGFDPPSFNLRGTGYNYFDGNTWDPEPTVRIEDEWSGWPSYAPLGENGEIVINHSWDEGLLILTRDNKGTGTWTKDTIPGPASALDISWPRSVTSGTNHDVIHIISTTYKPYMGQPNALLYSRSQDGGSTWDIDNVIIEGLGIDYYNNIGGDNYAFAEPRANTLAFIVGDSWMDLVLMKSHDNGDTWEKTVVWEHPYPFFDWNTTITDTFYCSDGGAAVALDSDGNAHITFGITRVMHLDVGTTYSYFPYVDGVVYWNETMPTFSNNLHALDPYGHDDSELTVDYNLIGWTQDVNGNGQIDLLDEIISYRSLGVSTMTNISVDNLNQVFLFYASTTETYSNGTYNYKHIWSRGSNDCGATWGDFLDLDSELIHIFDECVYPNVAPNSDDSLHIFYQADSEPGLALDDDHPYIENNMYYVSLGKDELISVSIEETNFTQANVSQNYPNPFNNTSIINVRLEKAANLSMEVYNLMGQKVYEILSGDVNTGLYQLTINASGLNSGIYFYTVKAGEKEVTRKMIIK
ncbi:MAG: T9SS type A sorting domain-containing protein [Bacteroidales bacterium]|nr:T9SS type A sorting domain-containing protein [Bacteroidales bacterium]